MRKALKICLYLVAALLGLFLIAILATGENGSPAKRSNETPLVAAASGGQNADQPISVQSHVAKAQENRKEKQDSQQQDGSTKTKMVSRQDYESIRVGDSCSDLRKRFGDPVMDTTGEVNVLGRRVKHEMIAWPADEGFASAIYVQCIDGKVESKSINAGLR